MKIEWDKEQAPAFAKIVNDELVRLSTMLPEFDEKTKGLRSLSLAARIAAGWYSVVAPNPDFDENAPSLPRAFYTLASFDAKTGIAALAMEQDEVPRISQELLRQMLYERESDALVIRAMRLQLAGDPGFESAKTAALAKVAEIKARHPDKA